MFDKVPDVIGVAVTVGLGVTVGVGAAVIVGVGETVGAGVTVAVAVTVGVGERVGLGVIGVGDGVVDGDTDGLGIAPDDTSFENVLSPLGL